MKTPLRIFLGIILLLLASTALLLGIDSAYSAKAPLPETMTGLWTGSARIIVNWCHQTNLTVSLQIHPDATVSGTVGDATLLAGRFKKNRRWLGRTLHLKTDYLISGELQGPIIATEQISRSGVFLPLNLDGPTFRGAVHTTGTHVGGEKRMVLSAAGLELHRESPSSLQVPAAAKSKLFPQLPSPKRPAPSRSDGTIFAVTTALTATKQAL